MFARRIFRSNFLHADGATADERGALAAAGVSSPMSQNYLAWRRALLWFGAVSLGFVLIAGLDTRFEGFDAPENPGILKFVVVCLFLAEIGACALAVMAALRWTKVASTRSLARFAWLCLFAVPFLLFFVPVGPFIDSELYQPQQKLMMTAGIGLVYVLTLAPKLLGLFPALIRSSLTLKTLLPESPMPGWIAVVMAPLYALFIAILLVVAAQTEQIMLIISVSALAIAPALIATNAGRLIQPCTEEEAMANIAFVRGKTLFANAIGIGAGVVFAFDLLTDKNIEIDAMDVLLFFMSFTATFLLLTVVTSDLLVGLFKSAFDRDTAMREAGLADGLDRRFNDLETLGLTQLRAGERELLSSIRKRIGGRDGDGPGAPPPPPPPAGGG